MRNAECGIEFAELKVKPEEQREWHSECGIEFAVPQCTSEA